MKNKNAESQWNRIVVALDFPEPDTALRLVDQISENITWFKLGPVLFTRSGPEMIAALKKRGKKVFLDLKLFDTPRVVADTVKQYADMGVEIATLHCQGGLDMLKAGSQACRGYPLSLMGVTSLTSEENAEKVLSLSQMAMESRLSGVLCSAYELQSIRKKALSGFTLACAGIRIAGEKVFQEDQKRIATPKQAIEWGADYVIVGRPIIYAREPEEALGRLFS